MAQVTDYDVANAAGSVVRADLNDILDAIKTLNAGTQNTLGITSPCQLFADTTNNKLKIRSTSGNAAAAQATFFEIGDLDTANLGLLKASGGSMTGVLELDDSNSASTPALCFDGDEDTGLFRKSANIMGFSSGGTEQMVFDANGITLRNEKAVRFSEAVANGSNYIALKAVASVASNKTISLPDESGTLLTTASTINTSQLSGASVTIGSTSVALGGTATTITGLSELTVTTLNATNQNINNIKNAGGANESTADQIYEGRAKAWVNFNGTGTPSIRDDFGVTSIGDHGQGIYQVNFDSNFSNTNYAPVGFVHRNGSTGGRVICHIDTLIQQNVGSYRFMVSGTSNAANVGLVAVDVQYVFLSFFGDQ